MNPYIFTFGNFALRYYPVLIMIGAFIGIILFEHECQKHDISKDVAFNIAFWVIIFGIIGARIYYVIFNYSLYKESFLSVFKIWEGGLAIHGGIIAGIIVIATYAKKYNMKFLKLSDYAIPSLLIGQAIGRWGNFFNSEAHGMATTLEHLQNLHIPSFIIDGMNIGGIYYEPTFLYESLYCLLGFIIVIIIRKFKYIKIGTVTGFYLMYYSVGRFLIESMRTDSLMFYGFKVAQIISIILFLIGLFIIMIISRKGRFEDLYNRMNDGAIRF